MNTNTVLTRREAEVAKLLAWGAAKKEVSEILFISTRTVENTARSIYAKCGIQKATELCVWWFCTKHGVSWDLSPLKQTVSTLLMIAFFNCNIITEQNIERYYRTVRTGSERRISTRRWQRRETELNVLEYLLF